MLKRFTTAARFAIAAPFRTDSIALLRGYAIVWNTLSSDRGGYKVRLRPGSAHFTTPTLALFHHNYRDILGNTASGTLRLLSDAIGVRVEIDLPDTSTGRDTAVLVGRRDLTGMSFAMVSDPEGPTTSVGGETVLDVTSFLCNEVTVTGIPAFVDTSVDVVLPMKASATLPSRSRHSRTLQRMKLLGLQSSFNSTNAER